MNIHETQERERLLPIKKALIRTRLSHRGLFEGTLDKPDLFPHVCKLAAERRARNEKEFA